MDGLLRGKRRENNRKEWRRKERRISIHSLHFTPFFTVFSRTLRREKKDRKKKPSNTVFRWDKQTRRKNELFKRSTSVWVRNETFKSLLSPGKLREGRKGIIGRDPRKKRGMKLDGGREGRGRGRRERKDKYEDELQNERENDCLSVWWGPLYFPPF